MAASLSSSSSSQSTSMTSLESQNKTALDYFIQMAVSRDMVKYLAQKASEVIQCDESASNTTSSSSQEKHLPPTPPSTPPSAEGRSSAAQQQQQQQQQDLTLPPVEDFITALIQHSHVQVYTLMPALVYLARLKERLPPVAKGMRCTVHRIFLASLILAAKYLNDSSPKNKYWARYTSVQGYSNFGFSTSEVNLMEKQLLYLLDWNLRITNEDLYLHLEPFLAPIRTMQAQRAEKAMQAMLRDRAIKEQLQLQKQQLQRQAAELNQRVPVHLRSCGSSSSSGMRGVYDSPQSLSSRSSSVDESSGRLPLGVSRHRPYQSVSSTSSRQRAPSRTPSLSPPSRSDTASSYANSPIDEQMMEQSHSYSRSHSPAVHIRPVEDGAAAIDTASVIQIPPPPPAKSTVYIPSQQQYNPANYVYSTTPAGEEYMKPAKKLKTSTGGIFTRSWWSAAAGYGSRVPQLSVPPSVTVTSAAPLPTAMV